MRRPADRQRETELVAACARGDEAAWRRFYERYQGLVLRAAERALVRHGVADPGDLAQDVASDVFAELLAKDRAALRRFEGRSSVTTWLRVLARRRAGRALRRRRPGALGEPTEVVARDPSPGERAEAGERARAVREQLEALAPRDRFALQLFYEGQRSYQEVAQALDLPADRVGTLLARARRRLGQALGWLED